MRWMPDTSTSLSINVRGNSESDGIRDNAVVLSMAIGRLPWEIRATMIGTDKNILDLNQGQHCLGAIACNLFQALGLDGTQGWLPWFQLSRDCLRLQKQRNIRHLCYQPWRSRSASRSGPYLQSSGSRPNRN